MWPLIALLALDSAMVRRIHVAPAETLAVTIAGAGAPVVLVPGLFGSAYGFRRMIPALVDAGYQVIVIEPLAVGSSSRPRRADYSLQAQSRRVARVMDILALDDAVLVGHSIGAAIVLRLAVARPELVRAIVSLEGGPAESAVGASFRRAMQYAPFIRLVGGAGLVRRALRRSLISASGDASWVTDEAIAEYTAGATADLGATLLAYLRMSESRETEPLGPHLGELHCPVHLLLGGAPHASGPAGADVERLRIGVPQLEVQTIAGAGHFLHEEAPDDVVRAIRAVGGTRVAAR
jgi:pimeloyl-ACP methyl ester carboxylesterase